MDNVIIWNVIISIISLIILILVGSTGYLIKNFLNTLSESIKGLTSALEFIRDDLRTIKNDTFNYQASMKKEIEEIHSRLDEYREIAKEHSSELKSLSEKIGKVEDKTQDMDP